MCKPRVAGPQQIGGRSEDADYSHFNRGRAGGQIGTAPFRKKVHFYPDRIVFRGTPVVKFLLSWAQSQLVHSRCQCWTGYRRKS